jgi:cytochrome c oxidase subunit 4
MSDHDHKPDVKLYLKIFAALLVLTVATVGVSYLDLPKGPGLALGLAIACVKAGLVAAYFMHLKGEKALIWSILGVTAFFLLFLFILPAVDHRLVAGNVEQASAEKPGEAKH